MSAGASSSSRWCPTPEQVMILDELYRAGIRTPNATQIQQITCYLSYHGKVEGKNVFYWFQNHKARERQKLRRNQQIRSARARPLLHRLHFSSSAAYDQQAPVSSCTCTWPLPSSVLGGLLNNPEQQLKMTKCKSGSRIYSHNCEGGSVNSMIRENDHESWKRAFMSYSSAGASASCYPPPPPPQPPLQTLQLFPVKATNFKEESTSFVVNMQFPSL